MSRVFAYIGSWRGGKSRLRGAAAVVLALAASGCSLSFGSFGGMFGDEEQVATGSIGAGARATLLSPDLSAEDWRRASAALAVALDPQGNGAATSWSNPESGLKGSISPVGSPFVKEDQVCRAFLASTLTARGQEWAQGSACRPSGGEWTMRDVKPWKKPG